MKLPEDKARFKDTLDQCLKPSKDGEQGDSGIYRRGFAIRWNLRRAAFDRRDSWRVGMGHGRLTREMVEEARVQEDYNMFLDYLGSILTSVLRSHVERAPRLGPNHLCALESWSGHTKGPRIC